MADETILIVEDNEIEKIMLQNDLERAGYRCLTAGDGIEALDQLHHQPIDLIISDLDMPRMGGLELLQAVKAGYGEIPFIILTREDTIDSATANIREGANDYLQKPAEPEALFRVIGRCFS